MLILFFFPLSSLNKEKAEVKKKYGILLYAGCGLGHEKIHTLRFWGALRDS